MALDSLICLMLSANLRQRRLALALVIWQTALINVFTTPEAYWIRPTTSTFAGKSVQLGIGVYGLPPFTYQWRRNGVNIPGAINFVYSFLSTIADDGAEYSVFVTDAESSATLTPITLSVSTDLKIVSPPASITRKSGSKAAFRVDADGARPLNYQWFKSDSPIPGATNDTLWLSDLKLSESSETYSVTVWNPWNTNTPPPATLGVVARDASVPATPYEKKIFADDPVGYWRLDDGENAEAAADAIGSFDGQYVPSVGSISFQPSGIPGDDNTAVRLTPPASIVINHALELNPVTTPWSAEWWIQPSLINTNISYAIASSIWEIETPTGNPNTVLLVHPLQGWVVYINRLGSLSFELMVGKTMTGFLTELAEPKLSAGSWYHLVLTDDLDRIRFYVNGEERASVSRVDSGFLPNGLNNGIGGPLLLGRADYLRYVQDFGLNHFPGAFDEVAIYNYPLSPAQIQAHHNNTASISIQAAGADITLKWPVGILQESESINGTFEDNLTATSPKTITPTATRFYRVRVP